MLSWDISAAADPSMGVECAVCTALPAGARAASHQFSARHRLPRDGESSDHQNRFHRRRRTCGNGDIDLAFNLNRDFYLLFLDGVYFTTESSPSFRRVAAPTAAAFELLVHTLSERIARHLERRGLLVRDLENRYLTLGPSDDATLDELRGHSITYRIALGPYAGRKALTLQTLPSIWQRVLRQRVGSTGGEQCHAEIS